MSVGAFLGGKGIGKLPVSHAFSGGGEGVGKVPVSHTKN